MFIKLTSMETSTRENSALNRLISLSQRSLELNTTQLNLNREAWWVLYSIHAHTSLSRLPFLLIWQTKWSPVCSTDPALFNSRYVSISAVWTQTILNWDRKQALVRLKNWGPYMRDTSSKVSEMLRRWASHGTEISNGASKTNQSATILNPSM